MSAMREPGRERVAIVGGDGRRRSTQREPCEYRYFMSPHNGGRGELVRFEQALRCGGIDRVVILVRWNAHSAIHKIKRLCKAQGVPFEERNALPR
ncbi:MAG: hypothetical protein Q8Q09_06380 [Deltaproteobacteria bacterium]|nr:hypothetical protein [Deltaproteobacteria bacterium]